MELSCDERVLKEMNEDIKKPYANSLLSLATERHILNGSPLAFGEGNVKGRIKNVMNYKKMTFWVVVIAVILVVAVAIGLSTNPINPEKPPNSGGIEKTSLSEDELAYFNGDSFFNGDYMNMHNQFLSSLYDKPADINLFELFYCGSGLDETITDDELMAVMDKYEMTMSIDDIPCPCEKNSSENMDKILTEYMNITLADTNEIGLENFVYLSDYDAYYFFHGDTNYRSNISFSRGEREGDVIRLFYSDGFFNDGDKVLTLRKKNGGYLFAANQMIDEAIGIEIIDVSFLDDADNKMEKVDNWLTIKGKIKIIVKFKGDVDQVDYIFTPTGTETYIEQKIIGISNVEKDTQYAEFTWAPTESLMGHISVRLNKGNESITLYDIANIYYER